MKNARLLTPSLFLVFQMCGCAKDAAHGESTTTMTTSAGDNGSEGIASASEVPTSSGIASTVETTTTTATMLSTSDGGSSTDHSCSSSMSCGDSMNTPEECDNFAQDCPEGQKCIFYSSLGPDAIDGVKCVDVTGADKPGDTCASGEGYSDSCIEGAICWDLDEQGMGHCVEMCGGSFDAPTCEHTDFCTLGPNGLLNLCFPGCNPLLQDCLLNPSDGCYALEEEFVCAPDASDGEGQVNDPCEHIDECEKGLLCADATFVGMGCGAGVTSCCTPFCKFPDGVCPNPDQQCVQWLDPMNLEPNDPLLDVGGCGVPI